jgi:hypothetical protein
MAKPFKQWTVLPHGKLSRVNDDILTVTGDLHMPMGDFPRRMTVVRLADGRLVIWSAIALHEDEMQQLQEFGHPAFLVVPNDLHRMDAKIWKDRYPAIIVVTPEGSRKKVAEIVPVHETAVDFGDPRVRFVTVPGTEGHESALEIDSEEGTTLVVNDLVWNVENRPGIGGFVFRLMGATGPDPKIPKVVQLGAIKDKPALKAQLEAWASLPRLLRILPSHGSTITDDPPGTLRRLAAELG